MSEENVEIIRQLAWTFNNEGFKAAAERFFADDVEFHEPPEQPAPRVAHGRQEVVKLFSAFDEAWDSHRSDQEEVRAIGPDKVFVVAVERFTGRDGIEVAAPAAAVFTLRDGKIIQWKAFWEKERALEAAGLSE
ncbi:MAG: nuclear transport factor 2 family protein [Actinobacteria bacterium]|nr:nuclear transport factor 2 family protein [Actinomycetota bacterium]